MVTVGWQHFARPGREAIRELAKEELQPVANSKTTQEILDKVAKLFPAANENEALPKRPEDAPRVMVAPDDSFRTWLKKAVQKIKASGIDGISTQVFRALQWRMRPLFSLQG